jgi:hypothetical protein
MPTPTRRPAWRGCALAFAAALAAFATPSHTAIAAEKRAACTADVFRLCSAEVPRVDHIIACLKKERPSLSPACRAVFDKS